MIQVGDAVYKSGDHINGTRKVNVTNDNINIIKECFNTIYFNT